jgi:hypothetical protein
MPVGVSAYTALANVTLDSAASSVSFSSISGSYRDLIYVISGQLSSASATNILLRFNGDSTVNYQRAFALGTGSSFSSGVGTESGIYSWVATNAQGMAIGHIMDYSQTGALKVVLTRQNNASDVMMQGQRWISTSAINSMTFSTTNNFAAGTSFALYGISG